MNLSIQASGLLNIYCIHIWDILDDRHNYSTYFKCILEQNFNPFHFYFGLLSLRDLPNAYATLILLNGVCHEIWAPDKQPIKYFRIQFRFRRDIRSQSDFCGVQHTAEIISAVCNIPQRSSPRCATYRGDNLRGVHHTAERISVHTTETISAEIISAVCNLFFFLRPLGILLHYYIIFRCGRCIRNPAHCRNKIKFFSWLWWLLKRQSGEIL